jgi:iron complex transport system substrate-binding protein
MRQSAPQSSPSSLGEGDRRRKRWWRGIALAATATLAACTQQTPIPQSARTIVSLNPCSDAILAEVTGPGQLRAISHYSADPRASSMDPAKARQYPATRGTLEEVIALRPDLIVDGTFVPPATAAAYRRLGLALETLPIAGTVEDSLAQIRRLAALAGHPDRGEALIHRIDAALKASAPDQGTAPIPALVWEPGGFVPGDKTLIADLLGRTGFTNFSAARGLSQADQLPLEHVLADPPRVILAAGGDRALNHPALASLRATARAPFDPALLYCAGPTIIRAATRLAQVRRALETSGLTEIPSSRAKSEDFGRAKPRPSA